MDQWAAIVLAVFSSIAGSTGIWAYFQARSTKKSATVKLLMGLAHEKIIFLGMSYIDRGWVTKDEYEDFLKYLYQPYSAVGGNGLAERVMQGVAELPIRGARHATLDVIRENAANAN